MPDPNPFEVIRGALYGLHIAAHLESADADGERDDALGALATLEQQMGEARESNVSIGDKRLTWQELAEHQRTELSRLRQIAGAFGDLDRCEHGRHQGDDCTLVGGCGGPSHGNPIAQQGVLGYDISGRPILVGLATQPTEEETT